MPDHYDKPLPTRKPPVPSPQKDVIEKKMMGGGMAKKKPRVANTDYRKGGLVKNKKPKKTKWLFGFKK